MDGFLYAASVHQRYLSAAILSAQSLREHYAGASITLVTEPRFFFDGLYDTFDDVIIGPPNQKRLKLWGICNSLYDRTLYIDADSEIQHPDIAIVHDQLGDADIMLSKIRPYRAAYTKFPGGELTDHCGIILYKGTGKVKRHM
ncbi:MAG: hypothetical protein ACR2PH_14290, partial [Desulfobulbia bacterium]